MRWYVDVSALGGAAPARRFCVESEHWQKALQGVRQSQGSDAALGNFSIELLDDGYRAIDPVGRTKYLVHRAPDEAPLGESDPGAPQALGAPAVPSPRPSRRGRGIPGARESKPEAAPSSRGSRSGRRGRNAEREAPPAEPSVVIPSDPVPAAEAPRPMQAFTAFEKMTGGVSIPLDPGSSAEKPAAAVDVSTRILTPFQVVLSRSEDPSDASPLTYREQALVLPAGVSLAEAEAVLRAQFEVLHGAVLSQPKGRFIQLAAFDQMFEGRPKSLPIATLVYKDWRHVEPEVRFPERDGSPARALTSMPPRGAFAAPVSIPSAPRPVDMSEQAVNVAVQSVSSSAAPAMTDAPLLAAPVLSIGDPVPKAPPAENQPPPAAPAIDKGPALATAAATFEAAEATQVAPPPTPSELQRNASEMAGEDDLTMVRPSTSPPKDAEPAPETAAPIGAENEGGTEPLLVAPSPDAALGPYAKSEPPRSPDASGPNESPVGFDAAERNAPAPSEVASGETVPLPEVQRASASTRPAAIAADPPVPAQGQGSRPPPAPPGGQTSSPPSAPLAPLASQPPAAMQHPSQPPAATPQPSRPPPAPSQHPAPAPAPQPIAGYKTRPVRQGRKAGDDLITDLFEATADLAFLRDVFDGTEFVADLVYESLPSRVVLVSFFDINTREFVVVRQWVADSPLGYPSVVLTRVAEHAIAPARATRAGRAIILSESERRSLDARWGTLDLVPQSMMVAPVLRGGRFLGLIEVASPLDEQPFTESDSHALSYIGEQFGEFLSERDATVDPAAVTRPKLSAQSRR